MRNHDFDGDRPLGLNPGDTVPVQDIVYLIYWLTDGTEQFGHQKHFNCMTAKGVLNGLCQVTVCGLPF